LGFGQIVRHLLAIVIPQQLDDELEYGLDQVEEFGAHGYALLVVGCCKFSRISAGISSCGFSLTNKLPHPICHECAAMVEI
jgi:hypothetical protein